MMTNKHLNLLGLCYRARKCVVGEELILQSVQSNEAKLILIAEDISERSKKTLVNKCKSYRVPYFVVEDRVELGKAIGKSDRVAVSITDKGFAKKMTELLS